MSLEQQVNDLCQAGKQDEALTALRKTVVEASLLESHLCFSYKKNYPAAIAALERCVQISPQNPFHYSNLAYLEMCAGRLDVALKHVTHGLNLDPNVAELHYNHGAILTALGRLEEAAEAYRSAIALKPDYAIVHYYYGQLLFFQGKIREGLVEYEWRFKSHPHLARFRQRFDAPDWDGRADLTDKRVLVYNEQGCGDAIQFARYLTRLEECGADVTVEVQEDLLSLFTEAGVAAVPRPNAWEGTKPELPPHDYVVSFSSLPHLFGCDLSNIPPHSPQFVTGKCPEKFHGQGLKVGIVWAGSIWHPNDHLRSMPLLHFEPVAKVPGVNLYGLQKGEMLRSWPGEAVNLLGGSNLVPFKDLSAKLTDFTATASVIKELDLVISVDTTVAHLAGSLDVPVWLVIQAEHDWRWLVGRDDSPWYPSMRIYRQRKPGDWPEVMGRVARDLTSFVKKGKQKCTKGLKKSGKR